MELRHLRAFEAVARTSSFTRAAAELHYSQSSITEQVQILESDLGTQLFDRSRRRLLLTGAGERLVGYATQVLLLVDEARSAVQEETSQPAGELTVAALETLCAHRIPALLSRYRARFPQVWVIVRQGNRGELYDWVRRGEVDVGLTFGDAPPEDGVRAVGIGQDRLMIAAPVDHRLARLGRLERRDLKGEAFLVTQNGCGFREMYDRTLGRLGDDGPRIEAEVASMAALCACVTAGMGLALLPRMVVDGPAARGEVTVLSLDDIDYGTTVTMSWLQRREQQPAVACFLALVAETSALAPAESAIG
jgi:DNA-binding transcriptional LysR family regulator